MNEDELIEHVNLYLSLKCTMFNEHFQAWIRDRTREYADRFIAQLRTDVSLYIHELYQGEPDQASDQ